MELINAYKNRFFLAMATMINRLNDGELFTKYEFFSELFREANVSEEFGQDFIQIVEESKGVFDFSDRNSVEPCRSGKIPFLLSYSDMVLLKAILRDKRTSLFLDRQTIEKLERALAQIPLLNLWEYVEIKGCEQGDEVTPAYLENFQLLSTAIREKRYISYAYHSANGMFYQNCNLVPMKIEYSIVQNKMRASLWLEQQNRPIKATLSQMSRLVIGEKICGADYDNLKERMEGKKEAQPLVMHIKDQNNAIERAILTFSLYDHSARFVQTDVLEMKLGYYKFDEMELVNYIMSFGPMIHVLSPQTMVDKIKERLLAMPRTSIENPV